MIKIAVIGLGYVGLPLAVEFGKKYRVTGFDINKTRVEELQNGKDHTLEADLESMEQAVKLHATDPGKGLFFQKVNQALAELAARNPDMALAKADGLVSNGDYLHFNAPSLREFGRRYFEKYKELCHAA